MRIYRELASLEPRLFRRPAVTLGVFDGVHRGHRALLGQLKEAAARTDGEAVVVTFDRHPRGVLTGEAPPTITSLEHRLVLFEREEIDAAVVLPFDRELAAVPAESFCRDILCGRLDARTIVLGSDAHFGRGREGNLDLLRLLQPELGYELHPVDLATSDAGPPISSTRIRQAILAGDLDLAADMLGRPVSLLGRVVRGDERGRTIGFPTANLELHQEICPPRGVYAGRVEVDGVLFPTMQNIGVRPTFDEGGESSAPKELLEVHLIGCQQPLYGRVLDVQFLRKLREEQRFAGLDALRAQLARDRAAALFAQPSSHCAQPRS